MVGKLMWGFSVLAVGLLTTLALSAPGDTLYIQGDKVNVRRGPSPNAQVMMQLGRGHKLVEFERRSGWVHVGIDRTGGKDGWVHGSLVSLSFPGGGSTAPADPKFDRFLAAVDQLNEKVKRAAGVRFFTKVENLGDGIVQLTATVTWLSAPRADREGNLNTLFNMWDAAEGSGLPIMVRIVDGRGNLVMRKARR